MMVNLNYNGVKIVVDGASWVKTPYSIQEEKEKVCFKSLLEARNYIDKLKKGKADA
jgi:hypothetical protein